MESHPLQGSRYLLFYRVLEVSVIIIAVSVWPITGNKKKVKEPCKYKSTKNEYSIKINAALTKVAQVSYIKHLLPLLPLVTAHD